MYVKSEFSSIQFRSRNPAAQLRQRGGAAAKAASDEWQVASEKRRT
jgi:hypothetical protein